MFVLYEKDIQGNVKVEYVAIMESVGLVMINLEIFNIVRVNIMLRGTVLKLLEVNVIIVHLNKIKLSNRLLIYKAEQ